MRLGEGGVVIRDLSHTMMPDGAIYPDARVMAEVFDAASRAIGEARRSYGLYPAAFHSAHEGYACILEEMDEAWDAIRANDRSAARHEMVQVAAMALRFLVDLPVRCEGATDGETAFSLADHGDT